MPEVRGVDGDLGREHDLAVVDRCLRVVGLAGRGALRAHHPRVRVRQIDRPLRQLRRHQRLAVALQHPALRVTRRRAPPLIDLVGGQVHLVVLLQPTERLEQPILPITRDRPRLALAMRLELAARDPKPLTPPIMPQHRDRAPTRDPPPARRRSRSSPTARPLRSRSGASRPPAPACGPPGCAAARAAHRHALAVELVLPAICLLGLAQDLGHDLAIGAVLIHRRVGLDLRPIDRDHPDRHQPRLPTQPEHVIKQLARSRSRAGGETPRSSSDPACASPVITLNATSSQPDSLRLAPAPGVGLSHRHLRVHAHRMAIEQSALHRRRRCIRQMEF